MITKKVLSDKYVEQLYDLFERKNWNTQEMGKYSVFDRFCERMAELETDVQVRICETPEVLKAEKYRENIDSVILIDDFIGSGETTLGCMAYLDFLRQEGKKMYILAMVAQKEGINNIQKEGIPVFADVVCEKGISDQFEKEEAQQKLDEMKKISKLLKVPSEMYLGFLKYPGV